MGTAIRLRLPERRAARAARLNNDFVAYGRDLAARASDFLPATTKRNFLPVVNVFDTFLCHQPRKFGDISALTAERFSQWLTRSGKKVATVEAYCRILKTIFRLGCEEMGLSLSNPFDMPTTRHEKKTGALGVHELKAVRQLDLGGDPDLAYARDLFLLSFYTGGLSLLSLATMRWADTGHTVVEYRIGLGSEVSYFTPSAYAREIMARLGRPGEYILPLLGGEYDDAEFTSLRTKINALFRKLDEMLPLSQPLSFRVARESWTEVEKNLEYEDPLS